MIDRRDKHELIYAILKSIHSGNRRISAVFYSSHMSYGQLKIYGQLLIDKGLINLANSEYFLTGRGLILLDLMNKEAEYL